MTNPTSRVQKRGSQMLHYCGPWHARLQTASSSARPAKWWRNFPSRACQAEGTTLFIAGHGTGNNENSRKAIERRSN